MCGQEAGMGWETRQRSRWWAEGEGPRADAPPGLGCPVFHCPMCSVGAAWGGCSRGPVRVTQALTAGSYWLLYMISKLPHGFVGRRQVGTVSGSQTQRV